MTPVRIAKKGAGPTSQTTQTDGPGACAANYDDPVPTPRTPPEPGDPPLLESPATPSSGGTVTNIMHQDQLSSVKDYYTSFPGQDVPQRVIGALGIPPLTPLGTFQQPASTKGWETDMNILTNSIGTTFMTRPVRFDPTSQKSCIRRAFAELSGYQLYDYGPWLPNKSWTRWGSKNHIVVTTVVLQLEWKKAYSCEVEVVDSDPGADLVIGREDLVQIEAYLGHPLRRIDPAGPLTIHYAPAAPDGILNGYYGGYDMAFAVQGTSSVANSDR